MAFQVERAATDVDEAAVKRGESKSKSKRALPAEVVTISRLVNAFFRWEFNSCENLVAGDQVHPIDYANACPDVAVTSLHYYFPWAMKALLRWSVYCAVTGRRARTQVDTGPWFEVADDPELDYGDKLEAYQRLADQHFDKERYLDFCADPDQPKHQHEVWKQEHAGENPQRDDLVAPGRPRRGRRHHPDRAHQIKLEVEADRRRDRRDRGVPGHRAADDGRGHHPARRRGPLDVARGQRGPDR